jgi:hypothetical protein
VYKGFEPEAARVVLEGMGSELNAVSAGSWQVVPVIDTLEPAPSNPSLVKRRWATLFPAQAEEA